MRDEPEDLDILWLLGLPAELNTQFVSEEGKGLTSLTMLAVRKPPSTTQFPVTQYPRFTGELQGLLPVKNIQRMSGRPIFGFRKTDPTRYWIVPIQSSLAENKFIFECPLRQIASLLDGYRDRAIEEMPDITG